jgi:hypothetical protein
MMQRMKTVNENQNPVIKIKTTQPRRVFGPRKFSSVIDHRTSDNCACARERAQRRRYEAVCEMHPRQNSMVWMV